MRNRMCVSALALSFLVSLAALPAAAKSVDGMRAQVPFDFHVGDRLVRSGSYTVKSLTDDELVLRISGGGEIVTTTTNSGRDKGNGEGRPRLVFHKYGDQYFLTAVWGGDSNGRTLSESKRERNLRRERRAARGGADAGMEVVIVAAF